MIVERQQRWIHLHRLHPFVYRNGPHILLIDGSLLHANDATILNGLR